jgi:branched-chain amino acid transport system substrate-binding protein
MHITLGMSLEQWQHHAKQVPEFPQSDDMNWINPDYSTFLKKLTPNLFERLGQKWGFFKNQWTPLFFKNILQVVTDHRITRELEKKPTAIITIKDESKFFVWGDLHAAFHSLLRGISWLVSQEIVSTNLEIINKDHYFVFHGDAISRGVYSMEALSLIANLMAKNPDNVIYIKGNHESNTYWHGFSLKKELIFRAFYLDPSFIPFDTLVNTFFSTLPDSLFVNTMQSQNNCILFLFNGLQGPYIKKFLLTDQVGLRYEKHEIMDIESPEDALKIEALIKTEEWMKEHRSQSGLGLLDQIFGITTWSVLSSPIAAHRELYNFSYDAFAAITINPTNIRRSTITINNRKIIDQEPLFKTEIPFNIITGRSTDLKNSEPIGNDIVIGSSLPLIQGVPIMGQRIKRGVSIAINEQNKKGGIRGQHIRFDARNDNYSPHQTRINIKHFIDKKITDIILCTVGSSAIESIRDYITEKKIALFCPITGDPKILDPSLKGLINLTGSYHNEIYAQIAFLIKEHSVKNFAFLYQIEELSPLMEIVRKLLPKYGIHQWLELPYSRGNINFSKQITLLKGAQIDAIALFATSQAAEEFIRQVDIESLSTKTLFGYSFLGDEVFRRFKKEKGLPVLLSARVPSPYQSTIEIVKEYRTFMEKNYYPLGTNSLEGYISGKFLIDLMLQCKKEINKENLLAEAEQLKDKKWGGFTLTFHPEDRSIINTIWLETGTQTDWIQVDEKNDMPSIQI